MVIYEDPSAFVLNKPPGLATQGGTKTHHHLDRLLDGLAEDGGSRPKLVHRLDKDTSGALLVAKTARSAGHFAKSFSGRTARKVYWALIVGVPSLDEGMIDAPLAKQPGTGGEKMHVDEESGLPARTRWRVIDRAGNRAAWVELQPLTGRTHQLRAHMAAIGHPIVGDAKYGGAEAFLTGGISRKLHLHARRIRIDAPEGVIDVTCRASAAHRGEPRHARLRADARRDLAARRAQAAPVSRGEEAEGQRGRPGPPPRPPRRAAFSLAIPTAALMHPNGAFAWEDRDALLRFVAERSFAHIFTASDEGMFVVHAPVLVAGEAACSFTSPPEPHRRTALEPPRAHQRSGREAYQSANWYVSENQVPTWHYEAVEIEGEARAAAGRRLVDLLDRLSERFERSIHPGTAMDTREDGAGQVRGMTKAIVGFEVDPIEIRGTRKFNQHKSARTSPRRSRAEGRGAEDIVRRSAKRRDQ
jgi:23S rRNA pseudouridine955/2504/2580 synthase